MPDKPAYLAKCHTICTKFLELNVWNVGHLQDKRNTALWVGEGGSEKKWYIYHFKILTKCLLEVHKDDMMDIFSQSENNWSQLLRAPSPQVSTPQAAPKVARPPQNVPRESGMSRISHSLPRTCPSSISGTTEQHKGELCQKSVTTPPLPWYFDFKLVFWF